MGSSIPKAHRSVLYVPALLLVQALVFTLAGQFKPEAPTSLSGKLPPAGIQALEQLRDETGRMLQAERALRAIDQLNNPTLIAQGVAAMLRDELHGNRARLQVREHVAPEAQRADVQALDEVLVRALAAGRWTEADTQAVLPIMAHVSTAARQDWERRFHAALQGGELILQGTPPPF